MKNTNVFSQLFNISTLFLTSNSQHNKKYKFIDLKIVHLYFVRVGELLKLLTGSSYDLMRIIPRVNSLLKNNGVPYTYNYLKEAHHGLITYIAGVPKERNPDIWVKRDRRGIPTILPPIVRKIIKNPSNYGKLVHKTVLRLALTSLSIYRILPYEPVVDLSPITNPYGGTVKGFDRYELASALKSLGFSSKTFCQHIADNEKDIIKLLSACPTGKISLFHSWYELAVLMTNFTVFLNVIYHYIRIRHYVALLYIFIGTITYIPFVLLFIRIKLLFNPKELVLPLGRLVVLNEQAGKSRIIAVVNFWLQQALAPLHFYISSRLKKMHMDYTFSQDRATYRQLFDRDQFKTNRKFFSFDLSNATDRLPLFLQENILDYLRYPSVSWRELMTIPFVHNIGMRKGDLKSTSYSVGQPLGAYSSFAMLSLTHHVIVQICALRADVIYKKIKNHNSSKKVVEFEPFSDYRLLGDDIVIFNDKVAEEYIKFMKDIDVKINLSKSIISEKSYEFLKRTYVDGYGDLSSISPKVILQSIHLSKGVILLFIDAIKRDYHFNKEIFVNYFEKQSKKVHKSFFKMRDLITFLIFVFPYKLGTDLVSNSAFYTNTNAVASYQLMNYIRHPFLSLIEILLPYLQNERDSHYTEANDVINSNKGVDGHMKDLILRIKHMYKISERCYSSRTTSLLIFIIMNDFGADRKDIINLEKVLRTKFNYILGRFLYDTIMRLTPTRNLLVEEYWRAYQDLRKDAFVRYDFEESMTRDYARYPSICWHYLVTWHLSVPTNFVNDTKIVKDHMRCWKTLIESSFNNEYPNSVFDGLKSIIK